MCIQDTEYNPKLESELKPDGKSLGVLWNQLKEREEEYDLFISKPSDFEASNYKGCAYGAPCAAAFTYAVIDPDLNVRPCDKLNSYILGNMNEHTIKEIWDNEKTNILMDNTNPLCMSKRKSRLSSDMSAISYRT